MEVFREMQYLKSTHGGENEKKDYFSNNKKKQTSRTKAVGVHSRNLKGGESNRGIEK